MTSTRCAFASSPDCRGRLRRAVRPVPPRVHRSPDANIGWTRLRPSRHTHMAHHAFGHHPVRPAASLRAATLTPTPTPPSHESRLQVIAELENDPAMAKFKEEYEKVFSALVNSNDSEKRLVQKCRDLNAEIVANAAKVRAR